MTDSTAEVSPPKKKRGCGFYALCGLGGLVVLGIIGSMGDKEKRAERQALAGGAVAAASSEAPVPVTEVTARELHRAFADNELAGKQAYGDRRLKVTGVVGGVDLDLTDDPVLRLATDNQFMWVMASFDKEDGAGLGTLHKGQKAVVICDKLTEVAGNPYLRDCTLAPVK